MKLGLAIAVWILMGAVLAKGLLMALHGQPWLLLLGIAGFVLLVAKIGCLSHD
jgi:hypothetical protein